MSCRLSHRLTRVHRAVSMALLCSVSYAAFVSSAQAATIGKTVVTSAQHEPLRASISVSDIRAADFSASLANPAIYQQMGLTPTDSMMVRFQPTSETSGQVYISTSEPVSKPFADIVLTINDQGQRNVVPKTLLMPLDASLPIDTTKNIVTGAKKPNLPAVSANNAKPLTLRKGAPPPLISASAARSSTSAPTAVKRSAPNVQLPNTQGANTQNASIQTQAASASTPAKTSVSATDHLTYTPSRLDNGRLANDFELTATASPAQTNAGRTNPASRLDNGRLAQEQTASSVNTMSEASPATQHTLGTAQADNALDTLNIQVTRQIQPSQQKNTDMSASIVAAASKNDAAQDNQTAEQTALSTAHTAAATVVGSNIPADTAAPSQPSTNNQTAPTNHVAADSIVDAQTQSTTSVQYQVQRNDSLWIIAQQIAQENNVDIQTVMKQIQSQNPNAFINKNADQLKADAKLNLPNYDVLPSQQALEAAISAQKQKYRRRINTPVAQPAPKAKPHKAKAQNNSAPAAKPQKKPTITKTLPRAQFSVLAPGHNGNADGTQTKSAAATGNGLSTDILATLKASRQAAASQAQSLSKTSSALDSYTRKIQLQNQKLAELQARLKKLRNQ
ncbi:peptigoglycan-binding protein LysM [Psychrobacter sp. CAM01]|uniref:type IV pilus assembly protein FimV n=1 Tax=Psychrobacter sp. CAM01 TaxID=3080335 RepID=UPI0029357959|nr:peptigoglycan-binding protein LysM [Psychrobacter sp. CAM01]MDV2860409.1 peptigoglycan-binding protein LysM [Psychrobacter sp. CAM01]